jgi:hypothetical protein
VVALQEEQEYVLLGFVPQKIVFVIPINFLTTMKKHFIIISIFVALLATACSQKDNRLTSC